MIMPSRTQSCQTQLNTDSTHIILRKRGLILRAQRDREVRNLTAAPIGGLIAGAEADVVGRVMKVMARREAEAIARMPATSSTKSDPTLATTG
jgi:hypothetical protein